MGRLKTTVKEGRVPKRVKVTKSQTAKAVNGALRHRTQEIRITSGQRRAISNRTNGQRTSNG